MPDTAHLRRDYGSGQLSDSAVADTWREQFDRWFADAAVLVQPHAAILATADARGRPRARAVLIKSWADDGFVWATNYESRKAQDLAANPHAALCFAWLELERQVHVEGPVAAVAADESDAIFAARPREAQLAAWASPQSRPLPGGRDELMERVAAASSRFATGAVPRPAHWGGYRLRPEVVEFWQGRPNRLHDRVRFQLTNEGWVRERLGP